MANNLEPINKGIDAISKISSRMSERSPATNILWFATIVIICYLIFYTVNQTVFKEVIYPMSFFIGVRAMSGACQGEATRHTALDCSSKPLSRQG